MSGFPLYDNLIKDIPKKDLSVSSKEWFIENIPKVNLAGRELLYALIIVFHKEDGNNEGGIPYKGQKNDTGNGICDFSWVFSQFPMKLRHLLFRFLKMHLKQQDNIRNSN